MPRSLQTILLCIVLLLVSAQAFAETRAWLDRERVGLGETATLNIETDDPSITSPDYSPLHNDFNVSGHTSSRQEETINGNTRTQMLFAVALRPKREGVIGIPPLRVGGERTAPLTLTVVASAPAPASSRAGDTVFIEAQADASSPYVQQAVGYVVRLYYATALISGQLDQDAPAGATMQRVGEDVRYQRDIGGRRYTVVERRYLLIPERSGRLQIPGARFRGQGVGGFFDDLFGDGRRDLSTTGPSQTLQVRALPANAPQPWLPLRNLTLSYVSEPHAVVQAGEAATVTVEARADGGNATQLPELTIPTPKGTQVFADTPQIDESFEQGRPQVRIVRRFSIVPDQAGTLQVQGPELTWWDVSAGQARTTSLEPFALQVSPGAAGMASTPPATASTETGERPQRWIQVPFVQGAVHAWALATVGFALLWLVTLWWGLHRRPASAAARQAGQPQPQAPAANAKTGSGLKQALKGDDLHAIAGALQSACTPPAKDLDAVVAALDNRQQQAAVEMLQQARWGQGSSSDALAALRAAFGRGADWRRDAKAGKPLLAPLYPE